ncbi:winged helix-turn-helix domain-containing protein [Campylobacter geochelonis]|uniref:winged helix-turn-helix domain-containing protein n=1 Tax=Campylobacter geochelonis TaxID=1780362 RepID=UPI0007708412|nr:LysR family transcriptional regulator [Campylobacter geochelonis]CZE49893.1 CBS domain-containing protein [Campylobacter geochelonis]
MNDEVIKLIKELLNSEGKLDCGTAFKISAKTGVEIAEVGKIAQEIGVRIDTCELGQFGKFKSEVANGDAKVFSALKPLIDEKKRVFCKDAREAAKGVGLKSVRATLKEHKIDVKYCELGCFKEKKGKKMVIKTKTWIENGSGELLFGKGKTEVLDVISQTGSIKAASEVLEMNYKKCWTHLKILQTNLNEELFETTQGGGKNAGTVLKPRAYELMNAYKQLEKDIEEFANKRFKELFLKKDK